MQQESEIGPINNRDQKKVLYHLKLADVLLIFLPMAFVAISLILLTLSCGADMLCAGVAVGSVILIALFCLIYGGIALTFSLLTRRNISFRVALAATLVSIAGGLIVLINMEP
jgi:hypothetical protein